MNLEDEKKLVAEKLMGWKIYYDNHEFTSIERGGMGAKLLLFNWNPQTERKWWDEIWEKMNFYEMIGYMGHLKKLKPYQFEDWFVHTAKPETCWKALITTLEGHK